MSGLVVVVSGPGGVGKGTVVEVLVDRDPSLELSRSWTTRDPRPGEDPAAYVFVAEQTFLDAIEAGDFLEWNHFLGAAYYGSPLPHSEDDLDLVLEIDVNGARQIHGRDSEAILVFVDAPSVEDQRARLVGRGDTPGQVERRMSAGEVERELAHDLPYAYVTNDDVERAVDEIADLIAARRADSACSSSSPPKY